MKFNAPIVEGRILKRYKRFLTDIVLDDGEQIIAHTNNTGSMKTCWEENWPVALSYHDNPKRKLKHSLEMIHNGETWIGVNTILANKLAVEGIQNGTIKELQGYKTVRPEVKIGQSRIDILLKDHSDNSNSGPNNDTRACYVEVKSVTLRGNDKRALFPDAVSTRGQKHLQELIDIKSQGIRAVSLYIVQREDLQSFSPAKDIDPKYAELLKTAHDAGVEILVYACVLNTKEIKVQKPLPLEFL